MTTLDLLTVLLSMSLACSALWLYKLIANEPSRN